MLHNAAIKNYINAVENQLICYLFFSAIWNVEAIAKEFIYSDMYR